MPFFLKILIYVFGNIKIFLEYLSLSDLWKNVYNKKNDVEKKWHKFYFRILFSCKFRCTTLNWCVPNISFKILLLFWNSFVYSYYFYHRHVLFYDILIKTFTEYLVLVFQFKKCFNLNIKFKAISITCSTIQAWQIIINTKNILNKKSNCSINLKFWQTLHNFLRFVLFFLYAIYKNSCFKNLVLVKRVITKFLCKKNII